MYFKLCSRGYNTHDEEDEVGDDDSPFARHLQSQKKGDEGIRKPVSVDGKGYPYGIMKTCLEDDVKLFAKDLDPTTSWEGQSAQDRRRFFKRLYSGM
jgi:hypothetical protein